MKRLFYISIIMLVIVSPIFGQVRFENSSFGMAMEKARESDKYLFLSCYNSTEKELISRFNSSVYLNEEVTKLMNDNFVNIRIDITKGEGPFLQHKYGVVVTPTFIIFDSSGSEVSRSVSIADNNPKKFQAMIESMLSNSISKARERFKHTTEGAHEYITELNDNYLINERDRALLSLFKRRNDMENFKKENFDFYDSYINTLFHPITLAIMNNSDNAVRYLGKQRYKQFLDDKLINTINSYIIANTLNGDKIRELLSMSKQHKDMSGAYLKYFESIAPYLDNRDIEKIIDIAEKRIKSFNKSQKDSVIRFILLTAKERDDIKRVIGFINKLETRTKNSEEKSFYKDIVTQFEYILR